MDRAPETLTDIIPQHNEKIINWSTMHADRTANNKALRLNCHTASAIYSTHPVDDMLNRRHFVLYRNWCHPKRRRKLNVNLRLQQIDECSL